MDLLQSINEEAKSLEAFIAEMTIEFDSMTVLNEDTGSIEFTPSDKKFAIDRSSVRSVGSRGDKDEVRGTGNVKVGDVVQMARDGKKISGIVGEIVRGIASLYDTQTKKPIAKIDVSQVKGGKESKYTRSQLMKHLGSNSGDMERAKLFIYGADEERSPLL